MPRVLLIEDSATQAASFKMMLEAEGFDVEHADSLQAGLERLRQGGIDALLLDLTLPDSEGLQTLLTARAQHAKMPIVVLTHIDDEDLAATTLQRGAQDYLVKGEVNQSWLARSIQHAIARMRPRTAGTAAAKPEALVQTEKNGDATLATIQTRRLLDAQQIGLLNDQLGRLLKSGCRKLAISLAEVEYVSNGAMSVLIGLRRRMLDQGGQLCLCQLKPAVYDQLTVRKFHKLFDIHDSTDAALQSLSLPDATGS